ncbi:unnamed protein product [Trichobilharzia szidati]|nr:unnamed protein product [Trichobilharzia szidati]
MSALKHLIFLYFVLNTNLLAVIVVKDLTADNFVRKFEDAEALFGAPVVEESLLLGRIHASNPLDGCVNEIPLPPNASMSSLPYISLIKRGNCSFIEKVSAAERGGYIAAIVYNDVDDGFFPMGFNSSATEVNISSVMIGMSDGEIIRKNYCASDYFAEILPTRHRNIALYLIPFITCVLIFVVGLGTAYIVRCWSRYRRRHRFCLPVSELNKIPESVFDKNSCQYETCAICLEDYKDGEKLRILPCKHAYHSKCVDPWLVKRRSCCPICKKRVRNQPRIDISRFTRLRRNSATTSEAPLLNDSSSFEEDSDLESSGSADQDDITFSTGDSPETRSPAPNERTPLISTTSAYRPSDSTLQRMKDAALVFEGLEGTLGGGSSHPSSSSTSSNQYGATKNAATPKELQSECSIVASELMQRDDQKWSETTDGAEENTNIVTHTSLLSIEVTHVEVHTDSGACLHQPQV